jgi:hypothetical protein
MNGFRAVTVGCACVFLAACGGSSTRQASVDRAVAIRLAGESDAVGAALSRGDPCLAVGRARTLRSQVAAAISAGTIPTALAADARAASTRLASAISCAQPPPAPPPAPVSPPCAEADGQKNEHAQEKHANGKREKRKHESDQGDHPPSSEQQGCQ